LLLQYRQYGQRYQAKIQNRGKREKWKKPGTLAYFHCMNTPLSIKNLVEKYSLQPHPEGGWYSQTYQSAEVIPVFGLPARFNGDRPFSTAIYFLLEKGNFSAFHRIKSDELWHFYAGGPLHIYVIDERGGMSLTTLGNDTDSCQLFQYMVPAGCWFASMPAPGTEFSFVGCTVAPGFDFADFELAEAEELIKRYPLNTEVINQLCR
jgi:hypothetical protein